MMNWDRDSKQTSLLIKAADGAKALKELVDRFYESGSYTGLKDSIAKLSKTYELTDAQKNYLKQIIENKAFPIQKNKRELLGVTGLEDKLNVKFVRYVGFVDKRLYNNHKEWFDGQSSYRGARQQPARAESSF